jgi:hypothetical protein
VNKGKVGGNITVKSLESVEGREDVSINIGISGRRKSYRCQVTGKGLLG